LSDVSWANTITFFINALPDRHDHQAFVKFLEPRDFTAFLPEFLKRFLVAEGLHSLADVKARLLKTSNPSDRKWITNVYREIVISDLKHFYTDEITYQEAVSRAYTEETGFSKMRKAKEIKRQNLSDANEAKLPDARNKLTQQYQTGKQYRNKRARSYYSDDQQMPQMPPMSPLVPQMFPPPSVGGPPAGSPGGTIPGGPPAGPPPSAETQLGRPQNYQSRGRGRQGRGRGKKGFIPDPKTERLWNMAESIEAANPSLGHMCRKSYFRLFPHCMTVRMAEYKDTHLATHRHAKYVFAASKCPKALAAGGCLESWSETGCLFSHNPQLF
jgi:hypothetical protein